jgi:hypothetical protein
VLARYANSTSQLPDNLVRKEEGCLFRGNAALRGETNGPGKAAVSLCGGVIVSIYQFQNIQPLTFPSHRISTASCYVCNCLSIIF